MPLPPLIKSSQVDWIFKVTDQRSKHAIRDKCLIAYFLGSPCSTLEINRIQLKDVIHKSGSLNKKFAIKEVVNSSDINRYFYLTNKKLIEFTKQYLNHRVKNKIALGDNPDQYLGLDPDEGFFISYQGKGFSIAKRERPNNKITYTCDSLNRHIKMLLSQSGIENPSILSGRRTFAVNLHRKGFDVAHIHHLLGNKTLETTMKILTTDPVEMGNIAAQAF